MCGHRECYYQVLRDHSDVNLQFDDYALGLHLAAEHGCVDSNDFNKHYNVQILENGSPSSLDKKEHVFIHRFKTLSPMV